MLKVQGSPRPGGRQPLSSPHCLARCPGPNPSCPGALTSRGPGAGSRAAAEHRSLRAGAEGRAAARGRGDRVRTAGAVGMGGGRGAGGPAPRLRPARRLGRRWRGRGLPAGTEPRLQGPGEGAASSTVAPEPLRSQHRGAPRFPPRSLSEVPWERGWGAGGWLCSASSQTAGAMGSPVNLTSVGWAQKPELGKGGTRLSAATTPPRVPRHVPGRPRPLPDLMLFTGPLDRGRDDGFSSGPLSPSTPCGRARRGDGREASPWGPGRTGSSIPTWSRWAAVHRFLLLLWSLLSCSVSAFSAHP